MATLPIYASLKQAGWPAGMERIVALATEIDLNWQANVADDLGFRYRPRLDDQGESPFLYRRKETVRQGPGPCRAGWQTLGRPAVNNAESRP